MIFPSLFFVDRSARGRLRVSGPDRQSFLQGMVTSDVAALEPGDGGYAFLLDPTGHVLADARIVCRTDDLLLDVEPGMAAFVAETLDQYLIMEECAIEDISGATAQIFLGGVQAPDLLTSWGIPNADTWPEGHNAPLAVGDASSAIVAATRLIPGPGFDVYLPADARETLLTMLQQAGTVAQSEDVLEMLRIEAGIPRFGMDITAQILAPETGQQERAISYRKGCYIGQEIVARIDARGHTNRALAGFVLDGDIVPEPGAAVVVDGKEVGRITSATLSPTLGQPIALGYLRHEHHTPGTMVMIASQPARVAALPFVHEPN